ncbi:hypothetical protein [Chryseobacterium jejuense]|uniref:YD repeat-containing protein n=1 Tax=Chryseobacterium jejuense TaxID=445960 RepID=A0A2X2V8A2_CHRJE|nr:hypothetical protein [Chryseobacterium jejuense]SDI41268.1 hypothetical protein SAMN05421542_1142 [Chryseobacterium jejuense]SQB27002.1 Uncharacterised protein [Chryseobacterium jejuense]
MKKIILLAASLSAMMGWGQTSIGGQPNIQKIVPTTPETYSMFKAGDFPVDYRTGKLNISVPLHTISTKYGISIPISLTYNTGGIKVDETSSTVGLGWSLSVPNNIAVEVHGKEDLNNTLASWYPENAFDYQFNEIMIESFPPDIRLKLSGLRDNTLDTEPDIYHYNLPTISGSFVRDSNGNFHTIPYENIRITYSESDRKFTITDDKGIIYTLGFGSILFTDSLTTGTPSYVSSLVLHKIKLPNNEEINFKYETQMSYKNVSYSFTDYYYPVPSAIGDPCIMGQQDVGGVTTNRYLDRLLTEITYNNETVKLNYKNIINGISGRKDVSSDTPASTYALDNIQVINNKNNTVTKYLELAHDYFTSNEPSPVSDYKYYRLKLLGLEDKLQNNKYSFQYNETAKPNVGSFAQDIWGYFNGKIYGNIGLIPNLRYFNKNHTTGADRSVDANNSQAYILKKIVYPTGGYSSFIFENNTIWGQLLIPQKEEITYSFINNAYNNTQFEYETITMTTPVNEYFYIDVDIFKGEEIGLEFFNSCSNQTPNQFPDNESSMGTAYLEEFINNHWEILTVFNGGSTAGTSIDGKFFMNPGAKKRIRTERKGNCFVSLKVYKIKYNKKNNQNNIVGGLRIKKVEDFDGIHTYTKKYFQYHNPEMPGEKSSGYFASPLSFLEITPKPVQSSTSVPVLCSMYTLSADQAVNSSLLGKDVVNYEYVTEYIPGKGRKVYQFEKEDNLMDISVVSGNGFNPYRFRNKNLIVEKLYADNSNNLLKETTYKYNLSLLKNVLSSNTYNNPGMLVPSAKIGIYELPGFQSILYSTRVLSSYPIQSGKFLLNEAITKDYITGNTLITHVNNEYSLSDVHKPINLTLEKTTFPDQVIQTAANQYAYEKGNQKLINANMVGFPLETTVIKKLNNNNVGTTISKTETKYDDSTHLFPTSALSYDLQNPAVVANEVKYDKYDLKGNIQQYTTKDGVSTVIIWGYHGTQPIAKIENAKLENIGQSFIDSIVNASNTDASAERNNDETNLLNAFNTFKRNLGDYQITTYTYDPLIGVRSITPPSGIREVYLYDTAGRLKEVRENNQTGKLLKEFNYHYKN